MIILDQVVPTIISDMDTNITHVGYGSGSTTPVTTDTTLETETFRNAKLSSVENVTSIRVISRLESADNNNVNAEIGTFDAASGGNMFTRNLLNVFTKDSTMVVNYFIIGEVEVRQV